MTLNVLRWVERAFRECVATGVAAAAARIYSHLERGLTPTPNTIPPLRG